MDLSNLWGYPKIIHFKSLIIHFDMIFHEKNNPAIGVPPCAPGPDPSQGWELSKHFEVLNKQEMGVKHGKPSILGRYMGWII
jgi:hypothetical protein